MTKLVKYAKITDKVLAVLRIIIIAIASICGVALIVAIGLGQVIRDALDKNPNTIVTFTSGSMTFHTPVSAVPLTASSIRWFCVVAIVLIAVVVVVALRLIRLMRDLMMATQKGRPFSASSTSKVRQIGWWVIGFGLVSPLISLTLTWFLFGGSNPVLALSGDSVRITYGYAANGLALIVGIMMLMLSLVFDYGAKLQQQSDETL